MGRFIGLTTVFAWSRHQRESDLWISGFVIPQSWGCQFRSARVTYPEHLGTWTGSAITTMMTCLDFIIRNRQHFFRNITQLRTRNDRNGIWIPDTCNIPQFGDNQRCLSGSGFQQRFFDRICTPDWWHSRIVGRSANSGDFLWRHCLTLFALWDLIVPIYRTVSMGYRGHRYDACSDEI